MSAAEKRSLYRLVEIAVPGRPVLASSRMFRLSCENELRSRVWAKTSAAINRAHPLARATMDALGGLPTGAIVGPLPMCQRTGFDGRQIGHVYAPLDDACIHCQVDLPRRGAR